MSSAGDSSLQPMVPTRGMRGAIKCLRCTHTCSLKIHKDCRYKLCITYKYVSTALYPDSPETAIFSCDLTIARRRHFSRDIASALGLWHQPALKRVQSHCLSSISENYNCARLCTIKSSVYTEHHSREKRYQALPRAREGQLWVYAYCRERIKRPWAGNLKMQMKRGVGVECVQSANGL